MAGLPGAEGCREADFKITPREQLQALADRIGQ